MLMPTFDKKALEEWLSPRPEIIKKLAAQIQPGKLYVLKSTNHLVFACSYYEDGTSTVIVSREYNDVAFDSKVLGIKPEDLEECDISEYQARYTSISLLPL